MKKEIEFHSGFNNLFSKNKRISKLSDLFQTRPQRNKSLVPVYAEPNIYMALSIRVDDRARCGPKASQTKESLSKK
ncbi:hypothetical protein M514_07157 [Trichuris suis]|uniref:Uncharacterized protein n=1 Tax=Trichuris suis TaxID=68888 RepID=A0A085NPG3_9BILA|nr:hypothetical protein M513_07157 [Trichuris suis]KFD71359.1 hypothetical protein M514_07157 [Trichuris suis]